MVLLFTRERLVTLLKLPEGSLDGDAYTDLMAEAASEKVRSIAQQPNWVSPDKNPLSGSEAHAPARASNIALWLAKRAWQDQGNLQRKTAGPISATFFSDGVTGLTLDDDEREWLEGHREGGGSGGFWVMRHHGTTASTPRRAETPDGFSFSDGDMNFSHGMDMRGPASADSW